MPGAKAHRRFDDDHRRADAVGRQIPRRCDDEPAGANGLQRLLRSRGPILVGQIHALDGEMRNRVVNRRGSAIALAAVAEADVPVKGSRRRIRNRRIGRIPQAAGRQWPLGEIVNGYGREIGENERDDILGIIEG